jgi:hypothetical protein
MEPGSTNRYSKRGNVKVWPYVLGAFLVVIAGVAAAWLISAGLTKGGSSAPSTGVKQTSNEAGALDPNVKYDTAEGTIQAGGLNGEGTFHLVRDGGPSKNVYLTSSLVDLNKYVDKKVEIWGQTLASKKVGWLMEVAKVKVIQ